MNTPPPGIRSRLIALLIGPWYLYVVAVAFAFATDTPRLQSLLLVLAGAVAIMAVLVVFGLKAFRHSERRIKFNLSTILLFIVPLSIYLAAIRHVLRAVPTDEMRVLNWILLSGFSLLFMILSTAILIWLAEALMWLALILLRLYASSRHDRR